jgi:hypothetical protein
VSKPRGERPTLLDRWWVRLIVAGWIVTIITVYFWHRLREVLQLAGAGP